MKGCDHDVPSIHKKTKHCIKQKNHTITVASSKLDVFVCMLNCPIKCTVLW